MLAAKPSNTYWNVKDALELELQLAVTSDVDQRANVPQ